MIDLTRGNIVKTQFKKTQSLIAIAVAATFSLAAAGAHADELSDLKAQLKALSSKVSDLENKPVASSAPAKPLPEALKTNQEGKPYDDSSDGVAIYNGRDTEVRIYGRLEATLSTVNNQGAGSKKSTGFQTSWFGGDRLGFDVNHSLSSLGSQWGMPDLKVISKLEAEFEHNTGNNDTAGALFNRDSWVGLYSEKLGKLTAGHQNTLGKDFTANWGDPYGSAETGLKEGGYTNKNNFKSFIYYAGNADGTRSNSSIVWKKDWQNHWVTGLSYKFGSSGGLSSGAAGDFANGTGKTASIAYNKLGLVNGIYANLNATYNTANNSNLNHTATLLGGNIVLSPVVRYNLGFVDYKAQQGNNLADRHDHSWTNSFKFTPAGKFEYAIGYQEMKGTNAGMKSGVVLNAFADTSGATATANGAKKSTYGSITYHADKGLDLYVAADKFKTTGGWVVKDALGNNTYGAGQAHDGTTEFALGAIFKF